jgi:RluA family pseudouridine synthase
MSNCIKLSSPTTKEFWEIPILFEDEHLLALQKPSRLLTSPDRYDRGRSNLLKLLHGGMERGAPWAREHHLSYLANAHRLDFETSGVILLAKNKATLIKLADQFGSEEPVSTYVALVHGHAAKERFEVDLKIAPHPVKAGLMCVDENRGKAARTEFQVLEHFSRHTLLQCRPLTGRTHQIRVHLQRAKLPIVSDVLYGGVPLLLSTLKHGYRLKPGRVEKPLMDRVALHAEGLHLPHPETGSPVHITAPWPKDLAVAVKYLRRFAPGSGISPTETEV